MFLVHIFLSAFLIVSCKSQQKSQLIDNDEKINSFEPIKHPIFENSGNDLLLDQYRQLVANSLVHLKDSCQVHDFLQNIRRNFENDSDGQARFIESIVRLLEKQNIGVGNLYLPLDPSLATKSALFYFVSTSILIQDQDLDVLLNDLLYEKCCKHDENFGGTSICDETQIDKRNTVRKQKFHSWGGKRSGGNSQRSPAPSSDDDLDKDMKQSKITIRTPFRPWGGKRMNMN